MIAANKLRSLSAELSSKERQAALKDMQAIQDLNRKALQQQRDAEAKEIDRQERQEAELKAAQTKHEEEQYNSKINDLMKRHNAINLSGPGVLLLIQNPFAYKGKNVLIVGGPSYVKNLASNRVLLSVLNQYLVLYTNKNFLELTGVNCVAKVLGTENLSLLSGTIEVPKLQETECF